MNIKELLAMKMNDTEAFSSKIELLGDRVAVIQGSKGIVTYNPNMITITLDGKRVILTGEGLRLNCLSKSDLEITGRIDRVDFMHER